MVEIKQLITPNEDFYNYFLQYCIKSKPYDFCELKSFKLRNSKIKEYFHTLISDSIIYTSEIDCKISIYAFFSEEKDHLILEFAIGDNKFKPQSLIKHFHEILILAQKTFDKTSIKSTIQRKYKKQNFINWLKKYDKICEIIELENQTKIIWKNERLN
jgi:hypothetical protein